MSGKTQVALGGLRHPHSIVERFPKMAATGALVRPQLEAFLDAHPLVMDWIINEGKEGWYRVESHHLAELLDRVGRALQTSDIGQSTRSKWRPGLVKAWCMMADDPGLHLVGEDRT